jgi:hypothetical protein
VNSVKHSNQRSSSRSSSLSLTCQLFQRYDSTNLPRLKYAIESLSSTLALDQTSQLYAVSQLLDDTERKNAYPNPLELKLCKMSDLPSYTPPAASVFYILLGCHVYRSIFASHSACQILKLSDRKKAQVKTVGT